MKSEVSPMVIAIVAVVVVAAIGFFVFKALAPPSLASGPASTMTPPPSVDRGTFYNSGGMSAGGYSNNRPDLDPRYANRPR